MSVGSAPLITRYLRLRKEVLDPLEPGLSFEGLIDALLVLYEHCTTSQLKNQHQVIAEFVNKFQSSISKYHKLRISINDFDVKRIIGRGNFADVKLVKEKCSGNVYAMKVMKKVNGGQNTALFEEERDIMARTSSPWLTKLDYAFQDTKHLYLAMEFHAGGDLLSLLDKFGHKLEEKSIRFYTSEIILGIHDLHKMGYVHRDIKPENILLDLTGHIKIADFGSSAPLNSSGLVTKSIPVGTPEYIAPEVLQCLQNGADSHGRECDYWSVGILAYEMVFGSTPFSALDGSVLQTYSNIMSHKKVQMPSTETISKELKDLIEGLLKPAPKRYTYKQIIHHAFFGDIDWSNMKNVTPPHVPQVKGSDDASNFDVIEEETNNIDTSSLTDTNKLANLPFIGFTFTADKGKVRILERKENNGMEEELKFKATELDKYKIKVHQLEQQILNQTKIDESCQREFEATEKLSNELSASEQEVVQLKAECQNLKRVLEVERQDRAAIEHKTLQVLEDVRKKWAKNEEIKLEKLRKQVKEEQEKGEDLETQLHSTKRDLKSTQTELESVKGVKMQLKKKLQDYKHRLENAVQLETKSSENLRKLEEENQKLKESLSETASALNTSKITESKVETLERRLLEKEEEINNKTEIINKKDSELESAEKRSKEDKAKISDMESRFKLMHVELGQIKKEYEEVHLQRQEALAVTGTMDQIRTELTVSMKETTSLKQEISTLQQEVKVKSGKEDNLKKEIRKLQDEMKSKISEAEKKLESETKAKKQIEKEYKEKMKVLEGKYENKISSLQDKFNTKAAETASSQDMVKLEAQLANMEAMVDKVVKVKEELEVKLADKVTECDDIKSQNLAFKQQIEEAKSAKEELEKTITEKEKEKIEVLEDKNKMAKLEEEIRELKLDLKIEQREVEKKSGLLTYVRERENKTKEKVTELEGKVADLEKQLEAIKNEKEELEAGKADMEESQVKLKSVKVELEKVKKEKLDISMEKRRLEGDMSDCERKIVNLEKEISNFDEEKVKMKTLQANHDIMKEALIELDRQITEAEKENEILQEKISNLETENREASSKISNYQDELRKTKIATNEEKSAKLFAEQKLKVNESRLEDQEKETNKNKEFYEKNLKEYKELCAKLSDTLEELTGKNAKMESQMNLTSKVKSHLEIEIEHLKQELSDKITQLQSHKESNFKLTQGMEEAINKIEAKNRQLDELNLKIETDARLMSEQVTKHEGTIAQQTKLIDFLQAKVEELEGRKRTLADKLFGGPSNKENRENHLVVGYQDIQQQLQSEKTKNRKLADQLSRVRSEVVALKTRTTSQTDLPKSVLNQIDANKTAKHNIPHRLHTATIKKTCKCPVCQETLGFMNMAQVCKDCGVSVHSGCSSSLPPTCGLSSSLVSALQASSPVRPRAKSESRGRSGTHSIKDRPLPCPPTSVKEGSIQMLQRGDWCDSFLVLNHNNILDIYENSSKSIRVDQVSLTSPNCRVSVQSTVAFSEVYYINSTDRPYTFKITVHTKGKPEKALYFMCQNFNQKVEWVNLLDEVIKSFPANLSPVPSTEQDGIKELLAAVPPDNEILSMEHAAPGIVVIGTVKGLFTRDFNNEKGELRRIEGIDAPVHKIVYLKSTQTLLLACGSTGTTGSQLFSCCARAVAAGTRVEVEPVPETADTHIFAAHETKTGNLYMCTATRHMVSIFAWSPKRVEFVIRNKFSTDTHTKCIFFTDSSILVGTTKFYDIDLKTLAAEEFLDSSDPGIKSVLNDPEFAGSEPRQVLQLRDSKDPEFVLCFTRHLLFVDMYGQETRGPIVFSSLPMEHYLVAGMLCSSFSDRIIFSRLHNNKEQTSSDKVEVYTTVPHLVGSDRSKLYYTTSGDTAYHLVGFDVTKLNKS